MKYGPDTGSVPSSKRTFSDTPLEGSDPEPSEPIDASSSYPTNHIEDVKVEETSIQIIVSAKEQLLKVALQGSSPAS